MEDDMIQVELEYRNEPGYKNYPTYVATDTTIKDYCMVGRGKTYNEAIERLHEKIMQRHALKGRSIDD
jgi:hypothetical protein